MRRSIGISAYRIIGHHLRYIEAIRSLVRDMDLPWDLHVIQPEFHPGDEAESIPLVPHFEALCVGWDNLPIWQEWAQKQGIPTVWMTFRDPSTVEKAPGFLVGIDGYSVGERAAEHAFECGYRHGVVVDSMRESYRRVWNHGFFDRCRRLGMTVTDLFMELPPANPDDPSFPHQYFNWLRQVREPVALFCNEDASGAWYRDVCLASGIDIPAQVGLIGVNNLVRHCERTEPFLSSVDPPIRQMAEMQVLALQRLFSGDAETGQMVQAVTARSVVPRRSTALYEVVGPLVRKASVLIKKRLARPLDQTALARQLRCSRTTVWRAFQNELRCSPKQFQLQLRFDEAIRLLTTTRLSMARIAKACGFVSAIAFNNEFKRRYGITPGAFRRQAG